MQGDWKHIDKLEEVIAATKCSISERKEELAKLESHLSFLNEERLNLLENSSTEPKEKIKIVSKPHSFSLNRRNLPVVPVRQLSESGKKFFELPKDSFVSKSSGTSFGSTSSLINKHHISCSIDDISLSGVESPSRFSSTKGHKFSTLDLKFLKKITKYAKSPSKWDGSNPKLSISSMDEVLSESCSTDDLSADKSPRYENVSDLMYILCIA